MDPTSPEPHADRVPPARAEWTHHVRPVFLIGCPRSGTTWVQSLLAHHPAVFTGTETHFFSSAHLVEREFWRGRNHLQGLGAYLEPPQFYGLLQEMFWRVVSTLPEPAQQPVLFLEKSPHHALVGETLLNTFPGAQVIHLIRDPRTTVASLLRVSRSWASNWAPSSIEGAVEMWVANVTASRMLGATLGPEQFLELRYEEFVAAPCPTLRWIWSWLGLSADEALAGEAVAANAERRKPGDSALFPGISRPGATLNGEAVVYPADFNGPAPAEAGRAALTPEEIQRIDGLLGGMLEQTGYAPAASETGSASRSPAGTEPRLTGEKGLSVILVGEGDDPAPLMEGLQSLLTIWKDDWELILVPHCGRACAVVGSLVSGEVQELPPVAGETYRETLRRAALLARSRQVLVPTDLGLFGLKRGELAGFGGCRGASRAHVMAWLNWRAERRNDLFTS